LEIEDLFNGDRIRVTAEHEEEEPELVGPPK
jgi:hypothetical protein